MKYTKEISMPYIKQDRRLHLMVSLNDLAENMKTLDNLSAGDLNYIITNITAKYCQLKGKGYQSYNDIMGALEGCKLELYRKTIASYEDEKIKENGGVDIWV